MAIHHDARRGTSITLNPDPKSGPASAIVVSAVDRTGNESPRIMLTIR